MIQLTIGDTIYEMDDRDQMGHSYYPLIISSISPTGIGVIESSINSRRTVTTFYVLIDGKYCYHSIKDVKISSIIIDTPIIDTTTTTTPLIITNSTKISIIGGIPKHGKTRRYD